MNRSGPNEEKDALSKEDAQFLLDSLFTFFARVPQKPPLQSTLKKLQPRKLGVQAVDLPYCEEIFETVSAEISNIVGAYVAALKSAERVPEATLFALSCLSYLVFRGPDFFEQWKHQPNSQFGGVSPQFWAESHDIPELYQYLF